MEEYKINNEEYFEEIIPSKKTTGKQQSLSFLQKDMDMIHSEKVFNDLVIVNNDGSETRKQSGVVAERIKDRIYMMVQKITVSTIDRNFLEKEFKKEVLLDMNNKGIVTIDSEVIDYAIEDKIRNFIKQNISNEFLISKDDLLDMAQAGSKNLSYVLENIIPFMNSSEIEKVVERSVDENYNKITKKLHIPTMPTFGIKEYDDQTKGEDQFIVRINPDMLVRLVGINKNAPYATIYLVAKDKLDSKYTRTLYELLARCVGIMNRYDKKIGKVSFTYKELLLIFGSDLGKKKKRNPKYNPNTMPKSEEFLVQNGNQIYEVDKNDNIIHEDDYKKTYNDFKVKILNVALNEYNNKTDYTIKLNEIKRSKLGKISQRGAIELIEFIVTDDRPITTNNYIASLYFFKSNPKNYTLSQIKEAIKTKSNDFNRNTIIADLKTTEELIELELIENNKAFNIIKNLLLNNQELKDLYFDDNYCVVYNKILKIDGKASRIGDNCIECLERIQLDYPNIKDLSSINEKQVKIESYVPFTIVFNDENIRVNKRNYNNYKDHIEKLIKENTPKSFKGFKSKFIKQDFLKTFFPTES